MFSQMNTDFQYPCPSVPTFICENLRESVVKKETRSIV